MDGDSFSRATPLGLNAAHAVLDAARGAPFDPFSAERLLDALDLLLHDDLLALDPDVHRASHHA